MKRAKARTNRWKDSQKDNQMAKLKDSTSRQKCSQNMKNPNRSSNSWNYDVYDYRIRKAMKKTTTYHHVAAKRESYNSQQEKAHQSPTMSLRQMNHPPTDHTKYSMDPYVL